MTGGDREVRVPVPRAGHREYAVRVEAGGLGTLGEACREHVPAHRYVVIADGTVAGLYGERALAFLREAGAEAELFEFPPGEASKSREEWARLTDRLLEAGVGRDGAVVALGGGVTGDLAGFVAATYMRGLPVVQVPTTLLAMLDSSVGGKTGVDTPAGKNLVGAFRHPRLVVADPTLLETLPREEISSGLAEGVKAAAIADEGLFGWLEDHAGGLVAKEPGPLGILVRRAVEIKARVVGEDPEERGIRSILNFGHTVGHALERLREYDLPHGNAVAAGMRVEAHLGEELGVTAPGTGRRLAALLEACGLEDGPELVEGVDPAVLLRAARTDKKARSGAHRFVILERVGAVARDAGGSYTRPLPGEGGEELLGAALRAVATAKESRSGGGPDGDG